MGKEMINLLQKPIPKQMIGKEIAKNQQSGLTTLRKDGKIQKNS
jgi:hypothetical protein